MVGEIEIHDMDNILNIELKQTKLLSIIILMNKNNDRKRSSIRAIGAVTMVGQNIYINESILPSN